MREVKFARISTSRPTSAATTNPEPPQLPLLVLPKADRGVLGSAGGASGPCGGAMRRIPDDSELRLPVPADGDTIVT